MVATVLLQAAWRGGCVLCSRLLARGRRSKKVGDRRYGIKRMFKAENPYPNSVVAAASASPAKHFTYSSKTEAFASPPSLKGALGAARGEFFKTLL
ncbi:hypothetical protein C1H46_009391 [Malus baccata]|uniref:Uncharacterized protein n=1 Tax=Malus baccata TaxID=106549 RepID=A0A540N318_MALBA|nr:hypothetical protein C1H46_009391 [Malus baccata]